MKDIFVYNIDIKKKGLLRLMAKVLISLPDKFLTQVDELAENEQRTRSELIREALRTYIRKNIKIDLKKSNSNAEILEQLLS